MKSFNYYQPSEIRFGTGRLKEVGEVVSKYGRRCLVVTVSDAPVLKPLFRKVKTILVKAGVKVEHFDGVVLNPTTESITIGAKLAKKHNADVVLGLGGGSSMDSAKAIAVEATHPGTCWNYIWCRKKQPTKKTLPIITVTTTSGTGSQVTQVTVITNTKKRDKSAIYNPIIYPKVSIIDPELMLTVPKHITASTGFDVFAHAFESYLHPNCSAYIELLALKAIRIVVKDLPKAVKNGASLNARTSMAWADTLAGLCIANAGVTLPHGMGMAIGGMYPHIMHGEALAITYPIFTRYTYKSAIRKFATVARIFNKNLLSEKDENAAKKGCEEIDNFLKKIGMFFNLEQLEVSAKELPALAKQSMVLPDYKNNPKVASLSDIKKILKKSYNHK